MRTNRIITAAAVLVTSMLNLAAQNSEVRTPGSFTGIQASGSANVEIKQQQESTVVIEGPADLFQKVRTEVRDGVLQVEAGGAAGDKVKIIVGAPSFDKIYASGACNVKGMNMISADNNLKLEASGASDIVLDVAVKGTLDVTSTGASDVKLSGKTETLLVNLSGASDLKAFGLEAQRVEVQSSGSSDAQVNPVQSLTVSASGASDVRYLTEPPQKMVSASGSSSIAQKGASASDTTRVNMGKKKYTIISDGDEEGDDDDDDKRYDDDFKFWSGLDIHVNALLDVNDNPQPPADVYDYMELNYPRSIGVSWNIFQKNIHVYKNYVNIVTGLGLDWSVYGLRNNVTLRHDSSFTYATYDSIEYRKNRLRAMYIQAPIMLEFNTNPSADRSFHVGVGVLLGYNIFDNKLKQKYEEDGQDRKNVIKDDFNINPLRYGFTTRIGYGHYSIFANYNVSTLFEQSQGPQMYPVQAGVHIDF